MSATNHSPGLGPRLRAELGLRDQAMSGDLALAAPPTLVSAASATPTSGSLTRALELRSAGGAVHNWFNAELSASLAADGVSADAPALAAFRGGVAGITLTLATAAIASGSHATVSVWGTVMGYDLATAQVAFSWASSV